MFVVKNLVKHFTKRARFFEKPSTVYALNGVSFELQQGRVLGVCGESGCGKSTLGRSCLRLLEPDEGEVLLDGTDLLSLSHKQWQKKRIELQMVFQDPGSALSPRKNVLKNVGEALVTQLGYSEQEAEQKVVEALEQVGLGSQHLKRYPHEFSGGQQQRLCLARALVVEPKVIVCDEALSALDLSVQAQILALLKRLIAQLNLSVLFISHDINVIRYLCDDVLVMYLGEVVEQGSVSEVLENPQHPYTQVLLAACNYDRQGKVIGEPPSPVNPPNGCPFHPRCSKARADCSENRPPWKKPKEGISNWGYSCIY